MRKEERRSLLLATYIDLRIKISVLNMERCTIEIKLSEMKLSEIRSSCECIIYSVGIRKGILVNLRILNHVQYQDHFSSSKRKTSEKYNIEQNTRARRRDGVQVKYRVVLRSFGRN